MTDNLSYVFVNLNNQDHLVGKLWFHQNNGKQSTTVKYDELWLKSDYCYPLDPVLQLWISIPSMIWHIVFWRY